MRTFQPDKGGIGIAVNDLITQRLNNSAGFSHDVMSAHGDGGGQARIIKTASGGTQNTTKRIHNNFQCLRQRLIPCQFCHVPLMPDSVDDIRQAVGFPGKIRALKPGNRLFRCGKTFDHANRIDEKSADNGGVQAFKIQHHHRVI